MLASLPVSAGRVEGLYDAKIAVADESVTSREQAFREGLDQVFVRISGDSIVMDKLKRPKASRYVKQFSYEPIPDPVPGPDGSVLSHHLKIQYNGSAMEKYLLDNGFAAWGEYRPDLVIWLVVRDGRTEYVLKDGDSSLLKETATDALQRRGIPDRWPSYDKQDRAILSVSDIRGGFKEPVIEASQRYGRGPALTGSMIWNGRNWSSSWSLLMEGGNRHWSLDGADYSALLGNAMDRTADALGAVFAVHTASDQQQLTKLSLDVQGVSDIQQFHFLESYLLGLSAVEKVRPSQVDGVKAVLEVSLRSSEHDFLKLIRNDGQLSEVAAPEIKRAAESVVDASQPVNGQQSDNSAQPAKADLAPPLLVPENQAVSKPAVDKPVADAPAAEKAAGANTVTKNITHTASGSESADGQHMTHYYRLNKPL